jgi:hypothetical protein
MRNPFETKQAIELETLLKKLGQSFSDLGRKRIMADILAVAGLISNTPTAKLYWIEGRSRFD